MRYMERLEGSWRNRSTIEGDLPPSRGEMCLSEEGSACWLMQGHTHLETGAFWTVLEEKQGQRETCPEVGAQP